MNDPSSTAEATQLRMLYVNGTFGGGSLMSTELLLNRVGTLGVRPTLIRATPSGRFQRSTHRRLTNLEVKLSGAVGKGPIVQVTERIGRRRRQVPDATVPTFTAAVVENAALRELDNRRVDVLVVSSVSRPAWMRLRQRTKASRTPCVLYLREEALLAHLPLAEPPDLLLANSGALRDAAVSAGFDAVFIPSVVELEHAAVSSSRTTILMINPTAAYGLETVLRLARQFPDLDFALQESSRLDDTSRRDLSEAVRELPNVELRPFNPDLRAVFGDARVLLAPYSAALHSNRPRSVLEAQWNGIPVLAIDRPGLRESVGPGGVLVPPAAPVEAWASSLEAMLEEPEYRRLTRAAEEHARRPEVQPAAIAGQFVDRIRRLL